MTTGSVAMSGKTALLSDVTLWVGLRDGPLTLPR